MINPEMIDLWEIWTLRENMILKSSGYNTEVTYQFERFNLPHSVWF